MNRIGSLCTGYGGLDMAVERVLGGQMVWYSEFEKHPSTLLAQRFPGIPNLGDLTKIDWPSVPAIDILTGGYPCQPFSQAGKRLGEDDPRHLWPYIREAIRVLRPRLTILENVAGHRSKGFASVLRDCAEDGLDVRWVSVRASDAGAPHRRERLFFVVTDDPDELHRHISRGVESAEASGERVGQKATWRPSAGSYRTTPDSQGTHQGGLSLGEGQEESGPGSGEVPLPNGLDWGDYGPAIHRWESVLGRTAPDPTEPNKNGIPRLAVSFVEWMMGIPVGWVSNISIPYGAQIKILGNGVVPQQAELAVRYLTSNNG